jgi:hypothetical protein
MPFGWQLASISGSPTNTIGGNLSSNINGKDSWRVGSFGDQVLSFDIVLPGGETRTVTRNTDAELFNAVTAGLGLFGVITEVTLQLRPIESLMVETTSRPLTNVSELMNAFGRLDAASSDFCYAWIDAFAGPETFARSVFESARFVPSDPTSTEEEFQRRLFPRTTITGLTPETFWAIVRRGWKALYALGLHGTAFRAMNFVKYRSALARGEVRSRVLFPDYQYPRVKYFPRWNLKFAPEGFHEIHALFPASRFEDALRSVMKHWAAYGRTPELLAARRHRDDAYPLSFSGDGLSFTVPIALAGFDPRRIERFRTELVGEILEPEGKIYIAKFPYMTREAFRTMYPDHKKVHGRQSARRSQTAFSVGRRGTITRRLIAEQSLFGLITGRTIEHGRKTDRDMERHGSVRSVHRTAVVDVAKAGVADFQTDAGAEHEQRVARPHERTRKTVAVNDRIPASAQR